MIHKLKLGLVGDNIDSSMSPFIFQKLAELTGVSIEYALLDKFDIVEWKKEGYAGVSVTIPFKETAFRQADMGACEDIGAANTLKFGSLVEAHNTDVYGIEKTLGLVKGKTLVLGAGGAARAAVSYLKSIGIEPMVWNRSRERAERFCKEMGIRMADSQSTGYDVLVNATPSQDVLAWLDVMNRGATIFDMNYRPRLTPLLAESERRGFKVKFGSEMLCWQALKAFQIWTGQDVTDLKEKVYEIFDGR